MQSCCRTWPPNGSSRIRAKQKLLRKHKGTCKSSWSRIGSPKSFTLTIPWNLANPVKIFPGIIVRRHHTDESRNNHRYAVVVQDLATQWIQSYLCETKTSQETERSLRKFLEPSEKPRAEKFGALMTADHKVLSEEVESRNNPMPKSHLH